MGKGDGADEEEDEVGESWHDCVINDIAVVDPAKPQPPPNFRLKAKSDEDGEISGADLEAPMGPPRKEVSSTVRINVVAGGVAIVVGSRRASPAEATRLTAT